LQLLELLGISRAWGTSDSAIAVGCGSRWLRSNKA
jgi:hypothetical protein